MAADASVFRLVAFFAGLVLVVFSQPLAASWLYYYLAHSLMFGNLLVAYIINAVLSPLSSLFALRRTTFAVFAIMFGAYTLLNYPHLPQLMEQRFNESKVLEKYSVPAMAMSLVSLCAMNLLVLRFLFPQCPATEEASEIVSLTLGGALLIFSTTDPLFGFALFLLLLSSHHLFPLSSLFSAWSDSFSDVFLPARIIKHSYRKVTSVVIRMWGPTPRRLLTEQEFEQQGEECTDQGLSELRSYVQGLPVEEQYSILRKLNPSTTKAFLTFISEGIIFEPSRAEVEQETRNQVF